MCFGEHRRLHGICRAGQAVPPCYARRRGKHVVLLHRIVRASLREPDDVQLKPGPPVGLRQASGHVIHASSPADDNTPAGSAHCRRLWFALAMLAPHSMRVTVCAFGHWPPPALPARCRLAGPQPAPAADPRCRRRPLPSQASEGLPQGPRSGHNADAHGNLKL